MSIDDCLPFSYVQRLGSVQAIPCSILVVEARIRVYGSLEYSLTQYLRNTTRNRLKRVFTRPNLLPLIELVARLEEAFFIAG